MIASRYFRRSWILAFVLLLSVALSWRWLATLVHLAMTREEYTHVLLILPISLLLIRTETKSLRAIPKYSFGMGSTLLGLAVVGFTVAPLVTVSAEITLRVFSLVVFWIGSVVLLYGFAVIRQLLFPLLFLFLIVPLPIAALDKVIAALQGASTTGTFLLFKLAGVPVMRNGFLLSMPGLNIEVAKECSGIRSSTVLFITCLILAHLFLRSGWSKAVFILLVIPMSIVKNAVRIYTLSMLAMDVDPGFLSGRLHRQGGVVFFALALVVLFLVLRLLQHFERSTFREPGPAFVR